jgi:predicted PurR-regulated permease PerM
MITRSSESAAAMSDAAAGILGGLLTIIPVFGPTLSLTPPLIIGPLTLHNWPQFMALGLSIYAMQFLAAYVVAPR